MNTTTTETALIQRDDQRLAIKFTEAAEEMLALAIGSASMVVKVDSAITQEIAVDAQKACARVIKLVEAARKEAKAPVLEFGRAIDTAAEQFVKLAKAEEMRVAKLIGNFQQAEMAKARSAEAAQRKALEEQERIREEALAKADTLEKREEIRAEFSELTRAMQPPTPSPVKVEGQSVVEVWKFEVENPHLLANSHPTFVTIEPKKREITEALKLGQKVHGVRAWKETESRVRLEREPKAITV